MRSRSAASVLRTAGFRDVASMAGGIRAWRGLTAAGPPEAGMSHFAPAADAGDLIALAWLLEEGSRVFYAALAGMQGTPEAAGLFKGLVTAEERHQASLAELYRETTGKDPDPGFPRGLPVTRGAGDPMEGNVSVGEALAWARGTGTPEHLEFAMARETDSYDLYIKMGRAVPGEAARKVFARLVAEEKKHLERLAGLLDRNLPGA